MPFTKEIMIKSGTWMGHLNTILAREEEEENLKKKSILIKALFHEHNHPMFLLFRNINGFLNTGKGGTIYLGIVDEGKVKGLLLTQYQVRKIEFEFAMSVMIKVEQGLCN